MISAIGSNPVMKHPQRMAFRGDDAKPAAQPVEEKEKTPTRKPLTAEQAYELEQKMLEVLETRKKQEHYGKNPYK